MKRAGRRLLHRNVGHADQGQHGHRLHQSGRGEGWAWSDSDQGPGTDKRRADADHSRQRLTRADLLTALLGVAQRGEIGVVARPVEDVAHRRNDDERVERRADAVDHREDRVLHRQNERAGDQQWLDAEPLGKRQDRRAQNEAPGDDGGHRQQHERHGDAGAQQEDEEEDAAGALGESLDASVQVDAIDRVIAQESHGETDEDR